jgi:hypothetical protein
LKQPSPVHPQTLAGRIEHSDGHAGSVVVTTAADHDDRTHRVFSALLPDQLSTGIAADAVDY